MKDKLRCRIAEPKDAETLTGFILAMARETEAKALADQVVSSGVTNLINTPRHGFYVVAEKDTGICGSLMITSEWSDWRNKSFWWIQSVYVRPGHRRQGVYKTLYEYIKTKAIEDLNVCGLRLYVEQNNSIAKKTYKSLGMHLTPYHIYEELICIDQNMM
jgi:ribosomal protein S18 acetylase RimI-like enzyme